MISRSGIGAPFDLIGDHLPGIEFKPQGVEDNRVRDEIELQT
jgi:hypothetical protein